MTPAGDVLGLDPAAPPFRCPVAGPVSKPGVTVLVATHPEPTGDRIGTLALSLSALAADAGRGGTDLAVLVVADGFGPDGIETVDRLVRGIGRPYRVLAAGRPTAPGGPAAARNAGLGLLAGLRPDDPLRHRHLLLLDDDTALAPGGLAALAGVLDRYPAAIAAAPAIETVPDLAAWLRAQPGTDATAVATTDPDGTAVGPTDPDSTAVGPTDPDGTAVSRPLPGSVHGGLYELLTVTSHGSLIAGRGVGLLVRLDPVLSWTGSGGRLYFDRTPGRSTEDMLANATLSVLGELRAVPAVRVADLRRDTPAGTRRQQMRWGYDHAWLAGRLFDAGLVDPGIHVLDWDRRHGWSELHIESPEHVGFVVNPAELAVLGGALAALVADPGTARHLFGTGTHGGTSAGTPGIGDLSGGVAALRRLLNRLADPLVERRATTVRVPRPDLPPPVPRDYATMRDGLDGLLAHVAGNAIGSRARGMASDGLPRRFLYGTRQQTAPDAYVTPRHQAPLAQSAGRAR